MAKQQLFDIEDLHRDLTGGLDRKDLKTTIIDCDGDHVFTFNDVHMSHEELERALAFANHFYRKGIEHGVMQQTRKALEALGVDAFVLETVTNMMPK